MNKITILLICTCWFINVNAAERYRLEGQFGMSTGDLEIEFAGVSDDLDADNGLNYGVQFWGENDIYPYLSIGLQYNRTSGADYSEAFGATLLGATLTATARIEHDIDIFMVNAVLRDNPGTMFGNSKFHPYIGGGIGHARVDADLTIAANLTINGTLLSAAGTFNDDDGGFAGQIMGGFDYDITDKVYVGVNASYFMMDADLYGAEVEFNNFRAMGVVGYNF
jgi:opacity protein-like surface antigen